MARGDGDRARTLSIASAAASRTSTTAARRRAGRATQSMFRPTAVGRNLVVLNHDTRLYAHHLERNYDFETPIAEVDRHPSDPDRWGLRQPECRDLVGALPEGERTIRPGRAGGVAGRASHRLRFPGGRRRNFVTWKLAGVVCTLAARDRGLGYDRERRGSHRRGIARLVARAAGRRPARADCCRAMLNDALAQDSTGARREVGLLVAAVEDGVPDALRTGVRLSRK